MRPGRYIMTWCGVSLPVTVWQSSQGLTVTPPSGWDFSLDTVPDATFEPIP